MNALLEHIWGISPYQDRVWGQVTGMAPGAAVRHALMVLSYQAFLDESFGNDEYVLAGHIASAAKWTTFAKDWEELLPFGTIAPNGKRHFKMSEMAYLPERMERVPAFYRTIEEHALISVSCRMKRSDLQEAVRHVKEAYRRYGFNLDVCDWENPYYALFRGIMDGFHKNRELMKDDIALDETVDFIFDDKTEKSVILSQWNSYLNYRPELRQFYGATPRFENDQIFLPLQAADLWAWQVREWYEGEEVPRPDGKAIRPEKMANFDFGSFKGKKRRPTLVMDFTRENLIETLANSQVQRVS
jgi:hypothetical protein